MSQSFTDSFPVEVHSLVKRYNTRATAVFPGDTQLDLDSPNRTFKKHTGVIPQILRMEAERFTGSVKFDCPIRKSRAAMLVLRGRVLAALYGDKTLSEQLMGPEAHQKIMEQITTPEELMHVYPLEERTVIAASSISLGRPVFNLQEPAQQSFSKSLIRLATEQAFGAIIVFERNMGTVCVIYVDGLQIVGTTTFTDELTDFRLEKLLFFLERNPDCSVFATKILTRNIDLLMGATFSLNRLEFLVEAS